MTFDVAFEKLAQSKFRSRFKLSDADRKYIAEKGMDTIRRHAEDFVRQKLAPAQPPNDGKQTPMRGHPVFKAQHATTILSLIGLELLGWFFRARRKAVEGDAVDNGRRDAV